MYSKCTRSRTTINEAFFEELWPLILEENRCDTRIKNLTEFFIPDPAFDELWAHTLLAKKCFKNYQKPIELRCFQPKDPADQYYEDEPPPVSPLAHRKRLECIKPHLRLKQEYGAPIKPPEVLEEEAKQAKQVKKPKFDPSFFKKPEKEKPEYKKWKMVWKPEYQEVIDQRRERDRAESMEEEEGRQKSIKRSILKSGGEFSQEEFIRASEYSQRESKRNTKQESLRPSELEDSASRRSTKKGSLIQSAYSQSEANDKRSTKQKSLIPQNDLHSSSKFYNKPASIVKPKCIPKITPRKTQESTVDDFEIPPEFEADCKQIVVARVPTLEQQQASLRAEEHRRNVIAYNFSNRRIPWFVSRPTFKTDFDITDETRKLFDDPLDFDILQTLQMFHIQMILVDVGVEFQVGEMERWLKFCQYAQILAITRCPDMSRKLRLMGGIFIATRIEYDPDLTHQQELELSLKAGYNYAREMHLMDNCSKSFVFAFARQRGMCGCDMFRVLRKF